MDTKTIRPGLLVSLKTSISGGVMYERRDLPVDGDGSDKTAKARWETTRIIEDADEYDRATTARGRAGKAIRKLCTDTAFGLLCPESMEADLDAAIARARAIADEHNTGAARTRVSIYVIKGRIASSDTEAARAIGQEVATLIDGMNGAIDRLDPEAIRAAASKARELASMLSPELSEKVGAAVDAARRAARQIVKRIEKEGEQAAVVLADIQRGAIEKARMAFLDLDCASPTVTGEELPAVDVGRFAHLDDAPAPEVDLPEEAPRPLLGADEGPSDFTLPEEPKRTPIDLAPEAEEVASAL
jgi:hypothetical protein